MQGSLSFRDGWNTWLAFSTGARLPFLVYLFVVAPKLTATARAIAITFAFVFFALLAVMRCVGWWLTVYGWRNAAVSPETHDQVRQTLETRHDFD